MTTEALTSATIPVVPSVDDIEVLGAEEAHGGRPEAADGEQQVARPGGSPSQQHHHEGSFSVSYKAYLRAMSCALVNMLPFPWRARQPRCVLLGRRYDFSDLDDHEAFKSDFTSRVLFTYRHGFEPLGGSSPHLRHPQPPPTMNKKISSFFRHRMAGKLEGGGLTSDSGWGCMIRVFQMAMAQVLMHLHFGRDWRRPQRRTAIHLDRRQVLLSRCNNSIRRSYSCDLAAAGCSCQHQPTPEEILRLLNRSAQPPSKHQQNSNSMPLLRSNEAGDTSPIPTECETHQSSTPLQPPVLVYPWNLLPILTLFRDVPAARFSLHRIVAVGRIGLGIKAGAWFGPTSCSDSMAVLIAGSSNLSDLPGNSPCNQKPLTIYPHHTRSGIRVSVYHSKHGEISRNRVQRLFRHSTATPVCSATLPNARNGDSGDDSDFPELAIQRSHRRLHHSHERSASLPPCLRRLRHSSCFLTRRVRHSPKVTETLVVNMAPEYQQVTSRRPQSDAVIMFLSFRLGLDSFNMRYQPFLQSCFGMPQFQGLAGGGPLTSAYWFVAANDEHLYFLDPHSPVQPAVHDIEQCVSICGCTTSRSQSESHSSFSSPEAPGRPMWLKQARSPAVTPESPDHIRPLLQGSDTDGWTILPGLKINHEACSKEAVDQMFFPSAPKQLNWRALNPSMTLVFLCQSFLAFEDLLLRLSEVDSEGLISVVEEEGFGIGSEFGLHKSGIGSESRNLSFDSAEDGFYLL
eukprot:Gregarina_sp_Pseudo_9__3569@NODE_372_length_3017_cov_54_217596_g351_i0_p1_GENE_NODE_372_length_3017_cov_54_217596_g351_i0NODE_372_length_3017_cov_54_217596_g351_i0_p1_ORF_typecomplete_len739_score49_71Peptidase_C54/PF03416_19/4_1e66_NODE_372_length_3017_cov_54_217596_g351_i0692285